MHPLKLILSNLLGKPDSLFCYYGFQDVLELSNLLQMYWWMIKSFSGEANSKYYSTLILLLFRWCSKIKCFFWWIFCILQMTFWQKLGKTYVSSVKPVFPAKICHICKIKKLKKQRGIFQITILLTRLQIHLHFCMRQQISNEWKWITQHETNILPQLHATCNNYTSSC